MASGSDRPAYKPPRVFAIRDFPPGCGPSKTNTGVNSSASGLVSKERGANIGSEEMFGSKEEQISAGGEVLKTTNSIPSLRRDVKATGKMSKDTSDSAKIIRNQAKSKEAKNSKAEPASYIDDVRSKVKNSLRLFHTLCRMLEREEITKPGGGIDGKRKRRFDLQAAEILKRNNRYVNPGKPILGQVHGVEVGDEFRYRVELMIVGLHRPPQAGIDYTKVGKDNRILATSIVASGGYDDDLCDTDVLIYTGSGGNQYAAAVNDEPQDQKLARGNLALRNSVYEKNQVRVIRGFKETEKGKIVYTYTYDGVYTVERYWEERTVPYNTRVYKFELKRVLGQPEISRKEVKNISKKFQTRKGIIAKDISQGREVIPIVVINTIDDEQPPSFTYRNRIHYPDWCKISPATENCRCQNKCSSSQQQPCACARKNKGKIPYNHDGAIVEIRPLVYECGRFCKCPPSCYNRVSQNGIKLPLEVFKTLNRGWGVRSLSSIAPGTFVCEYVGELLKSEEAEKRAGNDEYLFDIGQNYSDISLKEGLMQLLLQDSSSIDDPDNNTNIVGGGFTIDAARYGNVGRFINHSCSPNLYAQNVLYDHDDKRLPHIILFAAENIPPLQELTYHYNMEIGQVCDVHGNVKMKKCNCGSANCSGRLY